MFRRLYDWTLRLAGHRHAERALATISFAESSFFPIPPDALLVPMILARPERAWRIAAICTIASVAGALAGYAIGYFLFDMIGQWLIDLYGLQDSAPQFRHWYADWGAALILAKGLTPIPFKLVTIASGLAQFNLPLFILTCLITRAARFFLIAGLIRIYGAPIQSFIERRLTLVCVSFLAVIISGVLAVSTV